MKRCPDCALGFAAAAERCPRCGWAPTMVDGFPAYAPDLAHGGGGFKASYFADLAALEEGNFWFQSRNRLILWALRRYCPGFERFLEIGCGTGYVLSGVRRAFPNAQLCGSEIFVAGLRFAAARLPSASFLQMDARSIPFREEFDVIGAFDVLEHIEADALVLAQVHDALRPGGVLLLTVPQHAWLWSPMDDYALHVRRYTAPALHRTLRAEGFRIVRSTSFVTTLLPAMAVSRWLQSNEPPATRDVTAELRISPRLNTLFSRFLGAEAAAISMGANLPVGGSRLVVARKA